MDPKNALLVEQIEDLLKHPGWEGLKAWVYTKDRYLHKVDRRIHDAVRLGDLGTAQFNEGRWEATQEIFEALPGILIKELKK